MSEVETTETSALWNEAIGPEQYGGSADQYRAAILEQYKLYVEMADRISNRRGLTNTFFLTLNTAVVATAAASWEAWPRGSVWWLVFPLFAVIGECVAWWWLVRSYRQLNAAKYRVVGMLEERLPASPYWRAEWAALEHGTNWRTYLPLSHLEQWIPVLFALVYIGAFTAAVLVGS